MMTPFVRAMRDYARMSKRASDLNARARAPFSSPEHPNLFSRMSLALLQRAPLPTARVIKNRDGVSDYLERFYLDGPPTMPDSSDPFDVYGQPRAGIRWPDADVTKVLHRFRRSDEDTELHNHPWVWSVSFILCGGYREERRHWDGKQFVVRSRDVLAGQINVILASTYHRVDLLYPETWSLFVMGPRTGETWNFWDRATGEVTPHTEFLEKKRAAASKRETLLCTCRHPKNLHACFGINECLAPGCGCKVFDLLPPRSPASCTCLDSCSCGHPREFHGMTEHGTRCGFMVTAHLRCRCDSFELPHTEFLERKRRDPEQNTVAKTVDRWSRAAPFLCLCGHAQGVHHEFFGRCLFHDETPCGCRGFAHSRENRS